VSQWNKHVLVPLKRTAETLLEFVILQERSAYSSRAISKA